MSIVSLADALLIDPDIDQERVDAYEQLVRTQTGNRFHLRGGRAHGFSMEATVRIDTGILTLMGDHVTIVVGDTVELTMSRTLDGLYSVAESSDGVMTVTRAGGAPIREVGAYPNGDVDIVSYPADIVTGVKALIAFTAKTGDAYGVTSKSVGRVTEHYADTMVNTPAGAYPASLLAFLSPYKRLMWDGLP